MMSEGKKKTVITVKDLVRISLMGAIGILLFYFIAFPLPFFPDFLTYDAGDIPGILTCFAMGPIAGTIVQAIKAFVGLAIGASKAGPVGALANFLAGAAYTLVAGSYYRREKTKRKAAIAMALGCIATAFIMGLCNYFMLMPLWGIPQASRLPLVITAILPFNLLKTAISSFVAFLLYKRIKGYFEK